MVVALLAVELLTSESTLRLRKVPGQNESQSGQKGLPFEAKNSFFSAFQHSEHALLPPCEKELPRLQPQLRKENVFLENIIISRPLIDASRQAHKGVRGPKPPGKHM